MAGQFAAVDGSQVVGYIAVCKACGKVYGRDKSPRISNIPTYCSCGDTRGTIEVRPEIVNNIKGLNFSINISCRETNNQAQASVTMSPEDLMMSGSGPVNIFLEKLAESISKSLTKEKVSELLKQN